MPQLQEGNIDIIAATMTKNPERAMQIDFSHTYFFTGQKFISKKGTVKTLKDLEGKRIGTTKGSTSEKNVAKASPLQQFSLSMTTRRHTCSATGQSTGNHHRRSYSGRSAC